MLKLAKQSTMDPTVYVYLMAVARMNGQHLSPIKVGIAWSLEKRLADINYSCPFEIEAIKSWKCLNRSSALFMERYFHEAHDEHRIKGEWFDMTPADALAFLDEAFSRREVEILTQGVVRKKALKRRRSLGKALPAWEILGSERYFKLIESVGVGQKMTPGSLYYRQKRA